MCVSSCSGEPVIPGLYCFTGYVLKFLCQRPTGILYCMLAIGSYPYGLCYRFRSSSLFFRPSAFFSFSFSCRSSSISCCIALTCFCSDWISLFIAMSRMFFLGWLMPPCCSCTLSSVWRTGWFL